jgi:hypothetical protein
MALSAVLWQCCSACPIVLAGQPFCFPSAQSFGTGRVARLYAEKTPTSSTARADICESHLQASYAVSLRQLGSVIQVHRRQQSVLAHLAIPALQQEPKIFDRPRWT